MYTKEFLNIVPFVFPLCIALICALLLLRLYRAESSVEMIEPLKVIVIAHFTAVFAWLAIMAYISVPSVFVFLNPFLLFSFIACHIFLYHFVFLMTKVHKDEKFRMAHYISPVVAFLTITAWSFFVPLDAQISINKTGGGWLADYKPYSIFYTSKLLLYFIFNIIYAVLGLLRTIRYRKALVNYSADEKRISFSWLYQLYFVLIGAFPMSAMTAFMTKDYSKWSWITLLPITLIVFRDVIITHNLILGNYLIIKPDSLEREKQALQAEQHPEPIVPNDVRRLETYMQKKKPYLNPKLKITDMTKDLITNRTSLSQLINRTYGMNFSRYINRFRLEELERMKADPKNAGLNELELAANAGFSDWRGYLRVKKKEEY